MLWDEYKAVVLKLLAPWMSGMGSLSGLDWALGSSAAPTQVHMLGLGAWYNPQSWGLSTVPEIWQLESSTSAPQQLHFQTCKESHVPGTGLQDGGWVPRYKGTFTPSPLFSMTSQPLDFFFLSSGTKHFARSLYYGTFPCSYGVCENHGLRVDSDEKQVHSTLHFLLKFSGAGREVHVIHTPVKSLFSFPKLLTVFFTHWIYKKI